MTKLLTRIKDNFLSLSWIKWLIEEWVITPAFWRVLSGAIYTFYTWVLTYVIWGLNTNVWDNPKAALIVLLAWLWKSILEWILKAIRDRE